MPITSVQLNTPKEFYKLSGRAMDLLPQLLNKRERHTYLKKIVTLYKAEVEAHSQICSIF